ncbi:MAG: SPFH domain-containing protein [bacterium]|nr:SPFH domain-containing protein [bacterium]
MIRRLQVFALPICATSLALGVFLWNYCRVYVPEGHMAIVTSKTGRALPPGAILAEEGEKGVQRIPLAEGRHFLNPINNEWRIVKAQIVKVGQVAVVTSKTGKELPPGEILAADELSKGVWKNVLGPGTYRLNPEGYDVQTMDAISIPIGYVGVVTSQAGRPAKKGSFAGPGEKGVMEKVLQPGLYYVNARAYQIDVVEVGMNQVSIVGKSGTVVLTKGQLVNVNGALKELQENTLARQVERRDDYVRSNRDSGILSQSEASSLNLAQKKSQPAVSTPGKRPGQDAEMARALQKRKQAPQPQPKAPPADNVAFGMNQFVQFPSSDGFSILLDMTVEFELLPENISRIFMLYGDLPAVVSKIILPQILSVSRMKGSDYKARDFIDGGGREKFQQEMTAELVRILGEKHILVRNAIVRHVEVPSDILEPIQQASIAKEQDLTNKTQRETAKKQAELNTEMAMVQQLKKETEQETLKITATTAAEMKKDVAVIEAQAKLDVAKLDLERATVEARIIRTRGEAEVKAKFAVENEKALGERRRAKVFKDSSTLADLVFAENMATNLEIRVIHAGEGTLWTDLKGAAMTIPAPVRK